MLGAICELDRLNRWNALANGKDLMTANHEEIRMAGMSEEEFLKRRQARKAAKEQGNKQKSDDAASEPSPIDEDAEEVDEPAKPAKKEPEEREEPVKPAKKQAEEIDEPVKPAKKEPEEIDEPVRTARKKVEKIEAPAEPSKKGKWIIAVVAVLLVAGGGAGGFVYYKSMIADTLRQIVDIEQKIVKSHPDCSAIGELKAENAALYRYNAIDDTYEATSSSIGDYQNQLGKLTTAEKSCAVEHEKRVEQAKADEDRKKRDEQIAALEAQKREAEARAMQAQVEAENAQKQAEAERQMRVAAQNEAAVAQGFAPDFQAPVVDPLIPEPVVTMEPEMRLTFNRALRRPNGALEYLIFYDKELQTPCYIAVHNYNIKAQDDNRYCTPYSGNDSDLTHPVAVTQTAKRFEDYAYCGVIVKPEKRNIPGIAGFFRAFNPTYYNEHLARFINKPIVVEYPDAVDPEDYFSPTYYHMGPGCQIQYNGTYEEEPDESCKFKNPIITEAQYLQYGLKPGDVFLTPSSVYGEQTKHQYWQVISGTAQPYIKVVRTPSEDTVFEATDKLVEVKDLDSKAIYEVLMPHLKAGMPARAQYCEAVNRSLINEARAGKWARVDNQSPLMKKK